MSQKQHRQGITFMNADRCYHYSVTKVLFFWEVVACGVVIDRYTVWRVVWW